MNAWKTTKAWGLALGVVAAMGVQQASATNPARLNINVTMTQNLSVLVNGVGTSTQTVAWNTTTANDRLVSPSSATVLNDSGSQTERWQLSTHLNSIPQAGTDLWTVSSDSSSVGANAFALQAVFGSSNTAAGGCPAFDAAGWDLDTATEITSSLQTYTSSKFADAALNNAGGTPDPDEAGNGRMYANSKRALCWRVITPATTDTTETQNIQLIVTAIAP